MNEPRQTRQDKLLHRRHSCPRAWVVNSCWRCILHGLQQYVDSCWTYHLQCILLTIRTSHITTSDIYTKGQKNHTTSSLGIQNFWTCACFDCIGWTRCEDGHRARETKLLQQSCILCGPGFTLSNSNLAFFVDLASHWVTPTSNIHICACMCVWTSELRKTAKVSTVLTWDPERTAPNIWINLSWLSASSTARCKHSTISTATVNLSHSPHFTIHPYWPDKLQLHHHIACHSTWNYTQNNSTCETY